jgi:hypothetical protein
VSEHNHTLTDTSARAFSSPLVDRLEPSIGEVSTGMGVLVTELIRRSLRTGVEAIGDGLYGMASEQVGLAVSERMPQIERSALDAADRAARERASEVAGAKVDELRQRTEAEAEELARQIRDAEDRSRQAAAEVEKRALEATGEAEKRALEATDEAARDLAGQIERAEQRVTESTGSLLTRELEQLQERSRGTAAALRKGLRIIDQKATRLSEELAKTAGELQQRLLGFLKRLEEEEDGRRRDEAGLRDEQVRALQEAEERWQGHLRELRQENRRLAARLAELEKPRGLWALLRRIFSRGKKA